MKTLTILSLFIFSAASAEVSTMQKLSKAMSVVLTNCSSEGRFCDKDNHTQIEEQLKSLSTLAHAMKEKDFSGDKADPTLSILSGYLSEEANAAYSAFKNGKPEYARGIVRSMLGTCIACHNRSNSGQPLEKLNLEPTDAHLKPIEQAEFYAGTRQFDRAEKEFLSIIENSEVASNDPYSWEHAIRQSLTIAIRVKKDPILAKKVIDTALTQKKAAYTTREDLTQWKKSIDQWIKEPKTTVKTEKGMLSEGSRLINEAHQLQKYPMDHSADVLYLRASAAYYSLIEAAPNGKNVSDALLMEGICNEVLSPLGLEDLHRLYYEACIKKSPHSPVAMECYRRYERSTIQGYTGSAGTAVPEEIKQKLLDLFSQSMPSGNNGKIF